MSLNVTTYRRWTQWSLRSILLLMIFFAVAFSWCGARVRKEARLHEAVRLMSASPGWFPSDEYDPIALVRAVNALHVLGREEAIEALRRFAKEYPSNGGPDDRHEALRLIIPLLFDRLNPEDRFPSAPVGPEGHYRLDQKEWPFFSDFVIVEDDIPFHVVWTMGFSGEMRDNSYAIDRAQAHGSFRATPLRPLDSPFDAADRLIDKLIRSEKDPAVAYDVLVKRHIREQTLRSVSHLLPAGETVKFRWKEIRSPNQWRDLASDDNWALLKKTCDPMHIRWSHRRQAYVAVDR
jgi:hypothetical protein